MSAMTSLSSGRKEMITLSRTKSLQEEVRYHCLNEWKQCVFFKSDPQQAMTRCFGAVRFVLSVEPDEDESTESLGWWWDHEMHPMFRSIGAN